jgi:hypothetical protein
MQRKTEADVSRVGAVVRYAGDSQRGRDEPEREHRE